MEAERELDGLSAADLRAELQLLADQLSLRDTREMLGPVRERYPDLGRMPAGELRTLVARLASALRGRGPCDFIQRYRTGRFLALPPLSGEVWALLSHAERLRLLEADNRALDIAQAARHLARFFLSPDYPLLAAADAQGRLAVSPGYRDAVHRLCRLPGPGGLPGVVALNDQVTRMALAMEESPRETRGAQLEAIHRTISAALKASPAGPA